MKLIFIVPCFNAEKNLDNLVSSLASQSDPRWECIFINDISPDKTWDKIQDICEKNKKFRGIDNLEKKFALRNIVEVSREYQDVNDAVIGVIDGDDQLCNNDTVKIVLNEYEAGADVVWTAHKWDINGMNISKKMPKNVDPYQWPWCASHFRTFKASLLKNINNINFQDTKGKWFERGYDQALMLPLLNQTSNRRYIDKVCYLYNINSVSVNDRDWAENKQHSTINIVRARGFKH